VTTKRRVEAALRAEERRLDKANSGLHRFDSIQPTSKPGCNWTANFRCIASITPMDELREALERVQARFPMVDW